MQLSQTRDWIGSTINERYLIEESLGQGGMGIVFRADDTRLKRKVAIKLIVSDAIGTEGQARLLQEAQVAGSLNHPNIVTIFDAARDGRQGYIVMELVEGDTLASLPAPPLESTLEIIRQILRALTHAHQRGIIHRDLKPENVMLTSDGTAKLMDFGLARSLASRLSEQGQLMGTVYYMSPEQALGQEVDGRTDLYSLGVMLYELTTGELPFNADEAFSVITQHLQTPPVPPKALNEALPVYLNRLILNLLEKEPEHRPANAAAVLEALDAPQEKQVDLRDSQELNVLDRIVRGRMFGRQEEFTQARTIWHSASQGQGQVMLISGEPGIGKTRLMREIQTQAEVTGGIALQGVAYAESNSPYSAIAQIVRTGLPVAHEHSIELTDSMLADLLEFVPDIAHRYPNVNPNPKLDAGSERTRLFEHFSQFCLLLAQCAPLLIMVDDVHWADGATLDIFHHMARRVRGMPAMLLGTYREVELRAARPFNKLLVDLNRERLGTRIKLNRLNPEQTRKMLATILNEAITDEFLAGIYRETDGNPFFIEEVCRALVESGELYFEDGIWHRPAMRDLDIPQGIQVSVELRMANLPDHVQDALQLAAVLGREFDFDMLAAAAGEEEDQLIDAMERAEAAQMIEPLRGRGAQFQFVHALVPQAIYESIHMLRRRKMHRQVAESLEKFNPHDYASLAHHYTESGIEEKTLEYLIKAGENALQSYASAEAQRHLEAALHLADDRSVKGSVLGKLGESYHNLSQYEKALETWEEAVEILLDLGETDASGRYFALMARAVYHLGDVNGSVKTCVDALDRLADVEESPGIALLLAEACRAHYFANLGEQSEVYGERALEIAVRLELPLVEAETLATIALLKSTDEQIKMLEKAVEISLRYDLYSQAERALNNLALTYGRIGDMEKVRELDARSLEVLRILGSPGQELWKRGSFYFRNMTRGDLSSAREELKEMKRLAGIVARDDIGYRVYQIVLAFWAWLYEGELVQALEDFKKILEICRAGGAFQEMIITLQQIISILIDLDQAEDSEMYVKELLLITEQAIDQRIHLDALGAAITSAFHQHRFDLVNQLWGQFEELLSENEWDDEIIDLERGANQFYVALSSHDFEAAQELHNQGREIYVRRGQTWLDVRIEYLAGLSFLRIEDASARQTGLKMLQTAQTRFSEMGIESWADRIAVLIKNAERSLN